MYSKYLVKDFILNHPLVEGLVSKEFGLEGLQILHELREGSGK